MSLRLVAVIGVTEDEAGAHVPAHSPHEASLKELVTDWETGRQQWPSALAWLVSLAQSGNGITVEYGPVKELTIEATSLAQALKAAYKQAKHEYGGEVSPKPLEGAIEIISVGTPE